MKGRKLFKLMKCMQRFTTGTSNSICAILNEKNEKNLSRILYTSNHSHCFQMYYNHFNYIYNYKIFCKYNLRPPTHVESVPSV